MIRGGFPGAEDRPALRAVMRRPSESHGVACRANAILLLDDGWSCARVAAALSTRLSERLMRDRGEVAACIAATRAVIYGRSGCLKLPHRPGFEYKRPKSLPARADEAQAGRLYRDP